MITIQQTMNINTYTSNRRVADNSNYTSKKTKRFKSNSPATNSLKSISVSAFCAQLESYNIHIGRNQMFRWLRENSFLSKQKSTWNMPIRKYLNQRLFTVRETFILVADEQVAKYSPYITQKGKQYIIDRLKMESETKKHNIN